MKNLVASAEILQDSTLTLDGIEATLMKLAETADNKDSAMFLWIASCIGMVSDDIEEVAERLVKNKSVEENPT